jgi:fructose PTS system EIIBC or EIIC component
MKQSLVKLRQYLLSGVSFAIPFIACGGIMIATAIALAPIKAPTVAGPDYKPTALEVASGDVPKTGEIVDPGGPDFTGHPTLSFIMSVGVTAFTLMPVVLAGYIANAMAGKPGLVPGMVGGWLATHLGVFVSKTSHQIVAQNPLHGWKTPEATAGFLGAMLAGLIAGYIVMVLKKMPMHKFIRPIMPILIIPIVGSVIVGFVMLEVVGVPIAKVMAALGQELDALNRGHLGLLLAALLGTMIAFDMGGPINKAAFFFGAGLIAEGNTTVMGCIAAAICIPPLGMGLATMVYGKIWTEEQRESGIASLAMGMIGITEGAIPFAASDPLRVIPCICLGSAIASVIAMAGGVGDHAPHGGPIVLPVIDHRIVYVIAIVVGTAITAVSINVLKVLTNKPAPVEKTVETLAI